MLVKNVEKKENNTVAFQVEVNKNEFEEAVNAAYLKNKKSISVPGFRKGKAPRMVIEGMYGANVFYDDAIESIAPDAFQFGVDENKFKTVGRPEVTAANVDDDKVLTIDFSAALYPEVTLGQYKGIEAPKEEINITDADVDKYIEEMRKRNARQISVERAAKMGDIAVIDYDGYLNGEQFAGGKAENHSLELGSGQFVPGFEEQVVGMKPGDEKDIDITFPEDYHEELAGKAVVFKVKVHEVLETELPAVDDEFTKDVSEFDTLDEYKTAIKEELVTQRTKAVEEDFGFKVLQKAAENMTVDIPEAMIEDQMLTLMRDYDQRLMAQGLRLEEYIRLTGMDMAGFQAMLRPQAESQVKTELLLTAVVEAEKIEVSDEELNETLEKIASGYRTTVDEIKEVVGEDSMRDDMKKKKASDLILETAVAGAPEAAAAEETKPAKKAASKKAAKTEDAAEGEEKPAKKTAPKKTAAKKDEAPADDDEAPKTKKKAAKADAE